MYRLANCLGIAYLQVQSGERRGQGASSSPITSQSPIAAPVHAVSNPTPYEYPNHHALFDVGDP